MESNLSLSLELIVLMDWLLKKGDKEFEKIIDFALKNGFVQELQTIDENKYLEIAEILPNVILDFLFTLEDILFELLEKSNLDQDSKAKLIPTVEHLDLQKLDSKTIWLSLQQAKSTMKKKKLTTSNEAKRILFKKLLENWQPKLNEPMN
ncbi:MAG: hypothetical protein ABIA74_00795 [bacterium]